MNKKLGIIIAAVVVGVVLVGGGALAYNNSQNAKKEADHTAMMKSEAETAAMQKQKEADAMKQDDNMKKTEGDAMMAKGSFSDYSSDKLANAEKGKVVIFFSAAWCPTCKEANKNFTSSATPDGVTLLKADYDSSTDLKKKYGVTYQHTFVQVDKDGKQIKKWSGSTTYDQIKSQLAT